MGGRMNSLTPRELDAADTPLHSDLRAAEIDRRFYAALSAIKANRTFTLDAHARKSAAEHSVKLGVSAHRVAFK